MKYVKRRYPIIPFVYVNLVFSVFGAHGDNADLSFPAKSITSPQFWADLCYYRGAPGYTQIELYYSIAAKELKFEEIDEKLIASYAYALSITTPDDEVLIDKKKRKKLQVSSSDETHDKSKGTIDLLKFDLKPGNYILSLEFLDEHNQSTSNITGNLEVPSFDKSLQLSTPQFASLITKEHTQPLFFKGNKTVIPNTSRKYQQDKSYLNLYFEIYNLVAPTDNKNKYFQISYIIEDANGDTLLSVPGQTIAKPGTSCIKTQSLNIFGFKPGEYDLTVTVNDASPERSVSAREKFWVYVDHGTLSMSEEDIQRYRDQIKYFASNAELEVFDSLGPEGLEEYLINFWRRRDTSPETPENEFMMDVFAKIDYANKHFKGSGSGLNSDMGRVFIIYGQPDEIEDFSMNMDGKPYIIWHYYSSGSGKHYFAFVDKSADGVYRLVHSSVETEIKDEMWRQREL